jgi:hypothetical protein
LLIVFGLIELLFGIKNAAESGRNLPSLHDLRTQILEFGDASPSTQTAPEFQPIITQFEYPMRFA